MYKNGQVVGMTTSARIDASPSTVFVDMVALVDDGKSITRDPSTPSAAPQPHYPTRYAADLLELSLICGWGKVSEPEWG